jgi:hypothetical protein
METLSKHKRRRKVTKKDFMEYLDEAMEEGYGISVIVEIPDNIHPEEIYNHPDDVANKKAYYDKTYDDDMIHRHAPVRITGVSMVRKRIKKGV